MAIDSCSFDIPLEVKDEGFYRRQLPPELIEFSSEQGRIIFGEALSEGNMANYFPLIEQFITQAEPAFCGLSSLVMVLNALEIDPGRVWKGPWRWYDEKLTDCCNQFPKIKEVGVSLAQLTSLARCNGVKLQTYYHSDSTLHLFRQHVVEVVKQHAGKHMIASYCRADLGQTGTGHFSPIGGYHSNLDLVLILDVARFKYPPHWVPLSALWQAMSDLDTATGKSRGYLICKSL